MRTPEIAFANLFDSGERGAVQVDAYVINLASRPERWGLVSARLCAAGLEPRRIDALTPDRAVAAGFHGIRPTVDHPEYALVPGQFGCAASHLSALRLLLQSGAPGALICEDDVVLAKGFLDRATRAIEHRSPGTHVVQLGRLFGRPTVASRGLDALHLLARRRPRDRTVEAPFGAGAHCYWISADLAEAMLQICDPIFAPIDCALGAVTQYSSWRCEVRWPNLAGQDGTPSDIAAHRPWDTGKTVRTDVSDASASATPWP